MLDFAQIWQAADKVVYSRSLDAAQAMKAGLVDECHLLISPVVVGSGKKALPGDARLQLELLDEHRFSNGVVHLRYRPVP